MRYTTLLLIMVLLPAALFAQTPQPTVPLAQPAQLSFFGTNTYFTGLERINRDGDAGIADLVALGRGTGVQWAREELSWGNLERNGKGRWEWQYFDERLLEMAESGYGIVGMLLTTPKWARVGDCKARQQRYASAGVVALDYWCPPANPQDFADYVQATVERYDGDGLDDAPGSPRVAAWQIWNEPNAWETWPGSPAEYAALLEAGYTAAKAADPTAIVATGGVYVLDGAWTDGIGHSDGLRFLDQAFAARPTAWGAFDALAIHPYMPDVAPDAPGLLSTVTLWGRIRTTQAWLAQQQQTRGGAARPLWVSELGWSTCSARDDDCYVGAATSEQADITAPSDWRLTVGARSQPVVTNTAPLAARTLIGKTEQQQADYLVRAHVLALAAGVQHLSYFQLEDKFDGDLHNFWEEASIIEPRAAGYRPKLAYRAYTTLVRQLDAASFVGFGALNSFSYAPGNANPVARYHLRFRTADSQIVDVLWRSSGSETVALTREQGYRAELVSRDGARTALTDGVASAQLTLSETPVYLRQRLPVELTLAPNAITLLVERGAPAQIRTVTIANVGSGVLTWQASTGAPWLRASATEGQVGHTTVTLTIDPAGLAVGSYQTSLQVTSAVGQRSVMVRLVVANSIERRYLPLVSQQR